MFLFMCRFKSLGLHAYRRYHNYTKRDIDTDITLIETDSARVPTKDRWRFYRQVISKTSK